MKRLVTVVAGAVLLSGFSLVAAATPAAGTPGQDAAKIEAGKKVYDTNKCITCHAIDGKGMKKYPLDGVGAKLSVEDLKKWITTPAEMEAKQAVKQPLKMKASKLAPADLDSLVAYLASLKKK
jgi:mono/diheme cytochrome c family protein